MKVFCKQPVLGKKVFKKTFVLQSISSFVVIFLFSQTVFSQTPSPFLFNQRPGIKLSDNAIVTTNISLNHSYDTNVLYSKPNDSSQSYFFQVVGGCNLQTFSGVSFFASEPRPKFEFETKVLASFRRYADIVPEVTAQNGWEFFTHAKLAWNPTNLFSSILNVGYSRSLAARDEEAATVVPQEVFGFRTGVALAPGGRRRIILHLSYFFSVDAYEDSNFSYNNSNAHFISFLGSWNDVFRDSDIVFNVSQGFILYSASIYAEHIKIDSQPFRMLAGYRTILTSFLTLTAMLGYGNSAHMDGPTYNNFLAQVKISFLVKPFIKMGLAFNHDFSDSIFGNYYTEERVMFSYNHRILHRLVTSASAEYMYRTYMGVPAVYGPDLNGQCESNVAGFRVGVNYGLWSWIYVGASYLFQFQSIPYNVEISIQDVIGAHSYMRHVFSVHMGASR